MKVTVYHVSESCEPYNHCTSSGEWFFEPAGWISPVYSFGYPSQEAAREAGERLLSEVKHRWDAEDIRPTKALDKPKGKV